MRSLERMFGSGAALDPTSIITLYASRFRQRRSHHRCATAANTAYFRIGTGGSRRNCPCAVLGIERRCALTTVPSLREYCRTATVLDGGDLVLALAESIKSANKMTLRKRRLLEIVAVLFKHRPIWRRSVDYFSVLEPLRRSRRGSVEKASGSKGAGERESPSTEDHGGFQTTHGRRGSHSGARWSC